MISLLNDKDFDDVFYIMENSFPTDEYRTYEEQKKLLNNATYRIYTYTHENRISAFMAVWEFDDFLFLEHFALDGAIRNKGIGGQMLLELTKKYHKMICLEVEPPNDEISLRRINFYKRNGFVLNMYPYMQPSMSKGKKSIPLMIMTHKREIDTHEFENIRNVLYKNVYGI